MKAMIFAAGLGTRLRPLTDTQPKALIEVGGKAMLGHVIDKLRAIGVSRFVINIHHFPEQVRAYVAESYPDLDVDFSDESAKLLDTGGGLLVRMPLDEAVDMVMRGDIRDGKTICGLLMAREALFRQRARA